MKVRLLSEGLQRNGLKVTRKELEDVVRNFKHPVPITIGHPKSDMAPAIGFIEKVELRDGTLYGEYSLSPLGQILLSSNNYRNISAGLRRKPDGTWYLHHVALLGAVPPAAESAEPLKIVNLSSSGEEEEYVFEAEFADRKYVSYAKTDYPVCLDCEWDKEAAMRRLVEKGGWELLSRCSGAVEVNEDGELPEAYTRYKFPFCDVVNGEVKIIARAVSSGLAFLSGAMGAKVDPELARVVRPVFEKLKERVDKAREEVKEMKDLERLQKALKKEKLTRLEKEAKAKFSDEIVREILEFADSLPLEFSDEQETLIDRLVRIVEKLPKPVADGKREFSDREEEVSFSDAVKAF